MNTPAKQNLMKTVDNVRIGADTPAHQTREALSLGSADPPAADVEWWFCVAIPFDYHVNLLSVVQQ